MNALTPSAFANFPLRRLQDYPHTQYSLAHAYQTIGRAGTFRLALKFVVPIGPLLYLARPGLCCIYLSPRP
ncbi:hypothetical protein LY76DRAFT_351894 [Colletotrichum caudatum]|nr:hypothetical protein LY76DRAFT_351894 [Colletotrichum caudatum]